ncbi:MAG: translocation/assembly module TamB domain-containing protein [Terriglobales bacterium]
MTEAGARTRRGKLWKYLLVILAGGLCALGALAWYVTTDSFQTMVRQRLVSELERVTGGRVELGGVHTVPFRFLVDVRDLTIHGREAPGEIPYAHVDRLVAEVKLISVLGMELGFHSVVLDHPVIHVIVYPDGSSNQPAPVVNAVSVKDSVAKLFALSVRRLEVRRGELQWNDHKIPLDFVADNVSADMDYSLLHRHYNGKLLIGKIDNKWQNYRPVVWTAEAYFAISRDGLEVTSLKATSGRSHLQFSGQVLDFQQPNVTGRYEVAVDLQEAAAVLHIPQIRHGVVQASGSGSWATALFSTTGNLTLQNADWRDESLALPAASFSAHYQVNPQKFSLSGIAGKLLGGEVNGDAEIVNWRSSATPDKTLREKTQNEQRGTVRLRMKNLSAQEIATAISSSARPLRRMNLAGMTSGTLETRWRGAPRNAESEITLDVTSPKQLSPGQLPVEAHVHATYRNAAAELEVSEFDASTRATHVHASGTMSTHAALKVAVTTNDLHEWEPVLQALGYQEQVPVTIRGHATFNGIATGKLSAIEITGRIQSQELETQIPGKERIRWDFLAADIQVSPESFAAHNGILHHADAIIHFDVTGGLESRQFTASSPFSARVQMHNVDVAEILAQMGRNYPLSGKLDAFARASGTRSHPEGQGSFHLSGAVLGGEAVQQFESKFAFNREQVSLEEMHLAQGEARVSGNGTYDLATQAFRLNLSGDNFDLKRFQTLQNSRIAVEGLMDFEAQGMGTLERPSISAKIHLHDLAFDHESVGDYALDASTQGSDLHLSGKSQFKDAELVMDGDVHLRDDWPCRINLHFNHLDIDPVLRTYLRIPLTAHSAVAGELQLQGPVRNPRWLQVTGEISDFLAEAAHVQLHSNGPIHFTIADQSFNIQRLRLIGQATDLEIGGAVHLAGESQIDLHAEGHVDLALLHSFDPDFTSSGTVAVNMSVAGTLQRPTAGGRLQINGGSIQYSDLPSAMSDIRGSMVFNQDRLEIETLTAHVGGGLVQFAGYATTYNRQLSFDLSLKGQDVRLRYPPGVSSMTNAELRWTGTSTASTLSGNATVTKLAVTPGFDFAAYAALSTQASALPQTNPLLSRVRMDVHVVTTPELQMQTAVVRLSGDADLRVRGTAAKPILLGRADIIEGDVYFNGAKYRMERGDINFINPVTTTPVLDLQAATRVRDYDITVNLNGQLDKLNLSYHSEPPLPTADIISLLALGQTQEQSAQLQQAGQSPFAQQASSAVLAEALNSALSNRSQRLFGISHIKIDPQGINTETTPTQTSPLPAVTIEQQVRDNITLTYTTNLAQTSQQIIQVEYNITRDLSLVGIRDYNGVVSFEVRLRRRKK